MPSPAAFCLAEPPVKRRDGYEHQHDGA